MPARPTRRELLGLLVILGLTAVTRLPGLDARGPFDADQGSDMLVLAALLRGEIPLLGPPTSIGTFHHGAVYYYLLAPAVGLFGPNPVAVTGWIALFGIGAVAATWWLARMVGGPLAAAAAGLLAAVSPSGIDESTFIWNPNLIPLASALAFAGALRAWQTGSPRWWLLAGAGAMVTMQCHVLGIVVLPPLVAAFVADLRRRTRANSPRRPLLLAGAGALAIIAVAYLPLLAHELRNDFSETRAIVGYIVGGGRAANAGLIERVVTVGLRSTTWPFAGLVTDRPAISMFVFALVAALMAVAAFVGRRRDRWAAGWLLAAIGWSVVALAVFAPSLAVVTKGLPNDHYHAFLDPLVVALTGVGLARLAGLGARTREPAATGAPAAIPRGIGRAAAIVAGGVLVVAAVIAWPPAVSPDGGWPAARNDAEGIEAFAAGTPYVLAGVPELKTLNALRFPLQQLGVDPPGPDALGSAGAPGLVVVVCDPVLEPMTGAPCGGPAETAWLAGRGLDLPLLATTHDAARRVISYFGSTTR